MRDMGSKIPVRSFLAKVEGIAAEEPGYQQGKYGADHLCDCIGLIIGAIRRAGGSWRGTHGSNYAARFETEGLAKIAGTGDLSVGEAVYKAYEPGQGGYKLPAKYERGGDGYTGDMMDYYHVGVVVSVYPLRIRHMTTPRPKMDTSIGKWGYHGKLKKIAYSEEDTPMEEKEATVVLDSISTGSTVNMREGPGTNYGKITQIPVGTTVDVKQDKGDWCEIAYNGKVGWMMSNYLEYLNGESDVNADVLTRAERDKIDALMSEIEYRLESIRDILGRG